MNRIIAYVNVYRTKVDYRWIARWHQIRTKIRFSQVMRIIAVPAIFGVTASATSIVVIRDGTSIYLGSDSRISFFGQTTPESHCKIIQVSNRQFVAISGLWNLADYDVFNVLRKSVGQTTLETADRFAENAHIAVQRLAQSLNDDPSISVAAYHWFIETDHPILDAVFVGSDSQTANYHVRGFRVRRLNAQITLRPENADCEALCSGPTSQSRLGEVSTSRDVARRVFSVMHNPIFAIELLIGIEIAHHLNDVFWPINILAVEPSRAYWTLGGGQGCPAIQ